MRARLERGFGARLDAVRIHTDANAAAAARGLAARGFAAGRDVYLDLAQPELTGEAGFVLLAHEVAHVLQQTGRATTDQTMVATAQHGPAPVQCAEQAVDAIGLWEDDKIEYATIRARYEHEHGTGDAALNAAFANVEALVGTAFRPVPATTPALAAELLGTGGTAPAAAAKLTAFDALPERVRGFYLDCWKALGQFAAARTALDRAGRDLRTAFLSKAFYLAYRKANPSSAFVIEALARPERTGSPKRMVLKTLFFTNWANTYLPFLLSPTSRWMYDLSIQGGSFQKAAAAAMKAAQESKGLEENELFFVTLTALVKLDELRTSWLPDLAARLLKQGHLATVTRQNLAARLAEPDDGGPDWQSAPTKTDDADFSPEQLKMLGHLRPLVKAKAALALAYWRGVDDRVLASGEARTAFQAGLRADARLKPFVKHLIAMGKALFTEKNAGRFDSLPKPDVYGGKVKNAREHLRAHVYKHYEVPLIQSIRKGADPSDADLRIGWVLVAADLLDQQLRDYDVAADKGFAKVDLGTAAKKNEKLLADHRIGHRIRVARLVNNIAAILASDALSATVKGVLAPKENQVALDRAWTQSKDIRLGDMSRDLGAGAVPVNFPSIKLTFGLMERFLYADYYRQLTGQLETLLGQRKDDFSDTHQPILTDAVKAVETWPRPERWIMPGSIVLKGTSPTESISNLLLDHPRVAEVRGGRAGFFTATADGERVHADGAVVWAIPRMDQMVELLRKIPGLDDAVRTVWNATYVDPMPAQPAYWTWLDMLEKLAKAGTLVGGTSVDELLRKQLTGDYDLALKGDVTHVGLEDAARRATSHQRRVHEETRIFPHWRAYDRYQLDKMFEPREAASWMLDFGGFIMPDEDRPAQMAAMVLETAAVMNGAIGGDLRDIPISQVLPLISGTLRVWKEEHDPRYRPRVLAIRRGDYTEAMMAMAAALLANQEKTLKEAVLEHQLEFGMLGEVGSQSLRAVGETYHFHAGYDNGFHHEGVRYQLVKVYKSFRWHTRFPMGLAGGVPWPGTDDTAGDAFLVDEKRRRIAPTGDLLFKIKIGDSFWDVADTNFRMLGQVSHATAMYSILKGLKKLAGALDTFADAIMVAASWFPPTAAAARVARIAAAVFETMGSDELKEILDAFSKDGVGAIRKYVEHILGFFKISPEQAVLWLLFDTVDRKFDVPDHGTDRQRSVGRKQGKWARVAAIARNILRLGTRMLARVQRVRAVAQTPVRRAHLWLISHPGASTVARFVLQNYERLPSIDLAELIGGGAATDKDRKATYEEQLKEGANGLLERGAEMLNTLSHVELPEELVKLETVIEFIIDTIIDRLGFEYRIGYAGMKAILSELDIWQDGLKAIADGLKSGGIDPNELWRQQIRDRFNPTLVEFRDEFVGALKGKLSEVPFLAKMVKTPDAASVPIAAQTDGSGFPEQEDQPETEPFLQPGGAGGSGAPPSPPSFEAGAPLSVDTRAAVEPRLGHDLGHVRLHTGGDAGAMTSAYGAEGLTTGSHVFLRPGLDPGSTFGTRVLHHELTHVVQQTGPRPLGAAHSSSPQVGTAGLGLNVDTAREASADRVAGGGHLDDADLGATRGLQPFGSDFFRRFLREMTADTAIRKNMEEIDAGKGGAKYLEEELAEDADARAVAAALKSGGVAALFSALTSMKPADFKMAPFNLPDVAAAVVKYIADNADKKKKIESAIPVLVYKARLDHRTKAGKDAPVKTYYYVPPRKLELELADYLFAQTGVAITIDLAETKGKGPVARKDVVDATKPIKGVRAGYLHLPFLGGTAGLWDTVIENTFATKPSIKTKYASTTDAKAEYKAAARLVLSRLGPRPGTYDNKSKVLKLSDTVAALVEAEAHPPTGDLPANQLPVAKDYLRTNHADEGGTPIAPDPSYGHVGLRLGTYAEFGPAGSQKGYERDAHHTTQYLLLEYLHNMHKTNSPFPVKAGIASDYYPGVSGDASGVTTIKGIQVARFEAGRGAEMPIILLSKHTHRSDVHIHAEPDESVENKSKSAPGQAVDNHFYDGLGGASERSAWRALFKNKEALRAAQKANAPLEVAGKSLARDAVAERIFSAACTTYKWMRDEMQTKLKDALATREVDYYNFTAETGRLDKATHWLEPSATAAPWKLAVKWNNARMESGGAGFDPTK
ncbi:MAG: DUF4157 domain-containing protein [Myxococcales bacterium]|nr:DUF4157 domain-containing protein [Myxococcales bacterium]